MLRLELRRSNCAYEPAEEPHRRHKALGLARSYWRFLCQGEWRRACRVVPLLGLTVEHDDFVIAKNQLRNRRTWDNWAIVEDFENAFASWCGVKFAVAFDSGRSALFAAMRALDIPVGASVIVPGYTCVAVYNSVRCAGLNVVFSDIELDTYGVSEESVRNVLNTETRGIVIHHLYGVVARDAEQIAELARKKGLSVIEDCAQATGASLHGNRIGFLGDVAIFSSEQSKIFCTVRGGIAASNNPMIARRLAEIARLAPVLPEDLVEWQLRRQVYLYWRYKSPLRGVLAPYLDWEQAETTPVWLVREKLSTSPPRYYGARMPPPIAALALNQLTKVDRFNAIRRANARLWDSWCETHGFQRPVVIPGSTPAFLRYPVLVSPEMKQDTRWAERDLGVSLGVWFKTNLHPVPFEIAGCPNANEAVRRCVNFPTLF